jgi:hypothetical protein
MINEKIFVAKPSLPPFEPPFEEFIPVLQEIWDNKILSVCAAVEPAGSNGGCAADAIPADLSGYGDGDRRQGLQADRFAG